MKTNASSTASAWGIKRCICSCDVGTEITYCGSNLQLSMYKLHQRGQHFFFTRSKFTLVLLPKIISKIRYSKSCKLYHITSVVPRARHCGIPAILPPMSLKNAPSAGLRAHLENLLIIFRCFLLFPYLV